MHKNGQQGRRVSSRDPAEKTAAIWLALLAALGIHGVLLLLPLNRQAPVVEHLPARIELQLSGSEAYPEAEPEISPPLSAHLPLPEPEPTPLTPSPSVEGIAATEPVADTVEPVLPVTRPQATVTAKALDLDQLSEEQKNRLTSTLLTRQFIIEKSAVEKLFGQQVEQQPPAPGKEFHYPVRPDMITMLDQPMPDLPFEYTPGLVRFAYDPGLRGDMQRFWDKITPEFGWTTRYGTEVKCIWVLIIGGCGWK